MSNKRCTKVMFRDHRPDAKCRRKATEGDIYNNSALCDMHGRWLPDEYPGPISGCVHTMGNNATMAGYQCGATAILTERSTGREYCSKHTAEKMEHNRVRYRSRFARMSVKDKVSEYRRWLTSHMVYIDSCN